MSKSICGIDCSQCGLKETCGGCRATNGKPFGGECMQQNGIPTVVWFSPVLPFINDTEENLRGILNDCFDAGVKGILCFGIGTTMREGDREYFYAALDRHFPGMKQKYIHKFGTAYECASDNNDALMRIFRDECEKHGVMHDVGQIFEYLHRFPDQDYRQLSLF